MLGICFTDTQLSGYLSGSPLTFSKPLVLSENQKVKYSQSDGIKHWFITSPNGLRHLKPEMQPGIIFYIKETWFTSDNPKLTGKAVYYKVNPDYDTSLIVWKWINKAQMPQRYARHFIRVTSAVLTETDNGFEWVYGFEFVKH